MSELKPCPFCGEKLVFQNIDGYAEWHHPKNACVLAWIEVEDGAVFITDKKCEIEAWNRRADNEQSN